MSPPSSDTPYDSLDDDIIGPITPPAILHHLSKYTKSAKKRPKPYQRIVPNVLEHLCGEECSGCTSSKDLSRDQRERTQLQLRLKSLTPEARAHAMIPIQVDIEWRHMRAIAAALHVNAVQKHSICTTEELENRKNCSIAVYNLDETSFAAADIEFDHVENIASPPVQTKKLSMTTEIVARDTALSFVVQIVHHLDLLLGLQSTFPQQGDLSIEYWIEFLSSNMSLAGSFIRETPDFAKCSECTLSPRSSGTTASTYTDQFLALTNGNNSDDLLRSLLPRQRCASSLSSFATNILKMSCWCRWCCKQSLEVSHKQHVICFKLSGESLRALYFNLNQDLNQYGSKKASDAPEMPHMNAHDYYTPHSHHHHNPISHEPTCEGQLQSSILAPNNSHFQGPAGSYANPQSQLQFYTVSHGPAPTGTTVLYLASFDLSTSQAASSYGYHNTLSAAGGQHQPEGSDIGLAHDTSAYSNYLPPYSQNLVGGSHNSLALSQPPSSAVSTFQQACSQYPQDGSSNLNVAQSAPQGPAFPSTSLYLTSFDPNMSQAASSYGHYDSQPAADSQHQPEASNTEPVHHAAAHCNYQHPYLQGPVGGNYNNPVQSELPSSTINASRQSVGEVLHDDSFNIAQHAPQIESLILNHLKMDASRLMRVSLFRNTLFLIKEKNDELADAALNDVIAIHMNNDNARELGEWKLRPEGQNTLIRLKGVAKHIHTDCQGKGYAWGLVIGAYNLSAQILFKHPNNVIPSRKVHALTLVMNDGQLQSLCVPFGSSTIITMTEHILVDQGYHHYIPLDTATGDWEFGLQNTMALSAMICELEMVQCLKIGWFQPIDLHAKGCSIYARMKAQMASLNGISLSQSRWLEIL
ncbi:uncharacterized protein F5891DRAFT_977349 [Suillus fuscotomentosus]|uniref:Uncharacterized protein n=1 Tax=Suillus fuscotomentosus TaxID=1912939 RepID=A0AAD4ECM2_9AGAM|nr:uncharacterized protein F5891DRAFT_977349 [Suillus fuscotomentosus]KAG1903789.1 hypothetical protein F5891DRAFT_977349 [Suillus fuscotomentosus]